MAVEQRVLVYFDELVMALAKTYGETMDTHIYSPRDILSSIQGLHHVDAEEVVRCKDCKHWMYEYDDVGLCVADVPDIDGVQRLACDFCSYGERRSEK